MRTLWITSVLFLGCSVLVHGHQQSSNMTLSRGSYHHASTAAEGAKMGNAALITSMGQANVLNSQAASNYEDARSKYIANRMQATSTYFQARALNKQVRWGDKKPFDQQQHLRLTKQGLPDRPSGQKLDPLTGKIRWPLGLTMSELTAQRKQMEELFASRAEQGFFNHDQYNEVKSLTTVMLTVLQQHSGKLSGGQSIEARKFLESLSYEATHQAG